jgi:Holliday junction resolvasome RuvABC endonuclease subunit
MYTPLFILKEVMNRILGLDVSSSTIGWAILGYEEEHVTLEASGHIKPPPSKSGSLTYRLNEAFEKVNELFEELQPDDVAIEAYANKFASGRSSANTIIVLSVFNELSALACLRMLGYESHRYTVSSIRSKISKHYNKKIVSKDDMFNFIIENFKDFSIIKNRNNAIRKECYDETDAIAVALSHIISEYL